MRTIYYEHYIHILNLQINTLKNLKWTGLLSGSKSLDSIVHYKTKMLSGAIEYYIPFYK